MSLSWKHEPGARWDDDKQRILGGQPDGIFDLEAMSPQKLLPGQWWRVERDGQTVGYGWMDNVAGDAEILLATDPQAQHQGVGSFILEQLEREAAARGLNYLSNVVRPTHPDPDGITRWLKKRGFVGRDDGGLQRPVHRSS